MASGGVRSGQLGRAADIAVVSFNLVSKHNPSFKYQRLGAMALVNQRQYCERQGYDYYCATPTANATNGPAELASSANWAETTQSAQSSTSQLAANQACWAKIPAILQALQTHRWVLWADSDALVFNPELRLEDFCDPRFDVVTQCPRAYFKRIGLPEAKGLRQQPINSGVFLLQASDWTTQWLEQAYQLRPREPASDDWNGLGDQEALIDVLQRKPADLHRVAYVQSLQAHPSLHAPGNLFVHFYGNQADHRLAPDQVEEVLQRWEQAVASGGALPADLARFHWCCIQNKRADEALNRGGPERFLYQPSDLDSPCEAVN